MTLRHLQNLPLPLRIARTLCSELQRPSTPAEHIRLITIGPSHYCEKARWGLDLSGAVYTEDAHPPVLSAFETLMATGGSSSSTPVAMYRGTAITDSTDILVRCCPFLYPPEASDAARSWEKYFDAALGPSVRLFNYHHYLTPRYSPALTEMATAHTSRIEAEMYTAAADTVGAGIRRAMSIDASSAERSERAIRSVFGVVSDALADDSFLLAGRFTAADLAFASLAGPVLMPPEMRVFQPTTGGPGVPPALAALRDDLRETPAGMHGLRMYRKYRFASGTNARPMEGGTSGGRSAAGTRPVEGRNSSGRSVFPRSRGRDCLGRGPIVRAGFAGAGAAATALAIYSIRSKL